uniref:Uncharacterized protein n=1 Tax=viral metagenome TaxID=1070528 RepID=A0A6C0E660_9ZZZZ
MDQNKKNQKINEAIDQFYKLKNEYETNFYEKYVKPILNSGKSRREKKTQYQKLPKPRCINCGRNVGSIFTIKGDTTELTHKYTAKCGDITAPCALNISIITPSTEPYEQSLQDNALSAGSLNTLKKSIIKAKNDLMFGYLKQEEAFELFQKLTSELKADTDLFDYTLNQYIIQCDNPEKQEFLKKKQVEFEIQLAEFKDMIKEFNKTNDEKQIHSAVEFYINALMPQWKEIEHIKYSYNKVEIIDGKYTLVQKKNTLEQLEFSYNEPVLQSFVVGMKAPSKTLKNKPLPQNTKTRKQQPMPTLVLVGEEETEKKTNMEPSEEEGAEELETKEPELEES